MIREYTRQECYHFTIQELKDEYAFYSWLVVRLTKDLRFEVDWLERLIIKQKKRSEGAFEKYIAGEISAAKYKSALNHDYGSKIRERRITFLRDNLEIATKNRDTLKGMLNYREGTVRVHTKRNPRRSGANENTSIEQRIEN